MAARVDFLGATLIGVARLLHGGTATARARFSAAFRSAGVGSLPIVGLLGFAAGLVLTLLGTKELGKIGVDVGVPRLVGIVVLREIGALIAGIALAGRVASSYAAEIALAKGSSDEGVELVDAQVAPRVLALLIAGPLLVAYADALAIVGSALYSAKSLGAATEHVQSMLSALNLKHVVSVITKATAFAFVAALCGCSEGLRAAPGPEPVGRAVRRAVVASVIGVGLAEVLLIFVFKWIRL